MTRILLVEDEESYRDPLTYQLEREGFDVVTAVRNLLDNAVTYSPGGARVSVGVRRDGDLVEIAVVDEGIGIAADDQDRVFERFYRVDPARSRDTGGTGLGLSIVKHVAADHGGDVSVWSQPGRGSTFTLRLPVADARGLPVAGSGGPPLTDPAAPDVPAPPATDPPPSPAPPDAPRSTP